MQSSYNELSSDYLDRFSGIARVYGMPALRTLSQSHICILGLGGVGTWSAEALARSGVGQLTLIDLDEICVTNINRQLHALSTTVGRSKVVVMAERIQQIAPETKVNVIEDFFTPKTADALLDHSYSCVIDAIDHTQRKTYLIDQCVKRKLPIVVSGGAAGMVRTELVKYDDLSQSTHDALLRTVKRALKKEYGFSREGLWGIPAVFSKERPVYPTPEGGTCYTLGPQQHQRIDCNNGLGTVSFVTGNFGFMCARLAIEQVLTRAGHISKPI